MDKSIGTHGHPTYNLFFEKGKQIWNRIFTKNILMRRPETSVHVVYGYSP